MSWLYVVVGVLGLSVLVSLAFQVEEMRRETRELLTEIRDGLVDVREAIERQSYLR